MSIGTSGTAGRAIKSKDDEREPGTHTNVFNLYSKLKVLFLTAWYPTPRDAMAGLFVQKHAEAVARQGADVRVLFSDATGVHWVREMWRGWRRLRREWGLPDVVQMNVLDKNGILAMWLHRRYRIPYIIVEHWSGYLPANMSFRGGWHGQVMRYIARHAACILPVSRMLEEAMKQCGITCARWERVHNVVDDFFYLPPTDTIPRTKRYRLLHVSCFDERAKNIQGMLRAVRQVAEQRQDFELVAVGTGVDFTQDRAFADALHFPEGMLRFTGEQTPYEVCRWMQSSDAFVLFSRYENAPVVLSECMAVGLAIVSSRAGGIPEMVNTDCGILVPTEDESALAKAIDDMLDHLQDYPKSIIRPYGEAYRYDTVGKHLVEIYHQITATSV